MKEIKSERIKAVAKDGTVISKPFGDLVITLEDGTEIFLSDYIQKVIKLEKDLEVKERDLTAAQVELDKKIKVVENILADFINDFQETFGGKENE